MLVALEVAEHGVHEFGALLLAADDGAHFRLDVHLHDMEGGRAGFQSHAVLLSLADDLRLLEHHLLHGGQHDAVARRLHLIHGGKEFLRALSRVGELAQVSEQGEIVRDVLAAFSARHPEKHAFLGLDGDVHHPLAGVKLDGGGQLPELFVRKELVRDGVVLHLVDARPHVADGGDDLFHHLVVGRERLHPMRQGEVYAPHSELQKDVLHDGGDVALVHVDGAHHRDRHAVLLLEGMSERTGAFGGGIRRVEHDGEGLARRFQLLDDALLRGLVGRARDVRE